MRRIITTALAAAALMATTACATGGQPYSTQVAPKKDEIALHVTNNNFGAVTVRALSGGQDFYLGTVETDRKATFEVPPSFNHADLRFEAIVIDTGETFVSEQLSVPVGSVLNMDVAQDLPLSDVVVAP